ncbi:hypothetical protein GGI07_003481 [Coemansia sp. Benny D115]|nr:hypothetical protein GGI07_003481 [Coemansia sp. Benny D115]
MHSAANSNVGALSLVCRVTLTAAADSKISAIILPLSSTVWVPGKQGQITYRISGSPSDLSFEIDLMSGDPDNAQLVYVFEKAAVPTSSGVNTVTVDVPKSIPNGKYGIRLGIPDGSEWKYSQIFAVDANGSAPQIKDANKDTSSTASASTSHSATKANKTEDRSTDDADRLTKTNTSTPEKARTSNHANAKPTTDHSVSQEVSGGTPLRRPSAIWTICGTAAGLLYLAASALSAVATGSQGY